MAEFGFQIEFRLKAEIQRRVPAQAPPLVNLKSNLKSEF
jgi:hypothetical protein